MANTTQWEYNDCYWPPSVGSAVEFTISTSEKQEVQERIWLETQTEGNYSLGLSMSSGLTDPVISGSWSVDMNCITSGSGGRRADINVLDCCHYCGSCSIQELFECEWDACRSVGWRLQASWRLRARRIDDAVQSQPTAASLFTICLVDAAFLNSHCTNYYPYLWLCCFVIFRHGKIPLCPTRNLRSHRNTSQRWYMCVELNLQDSCVPSCNKLVTGRTIRCLFSLRGPRSLSWLSFLLKKSAKLLGEK